MDSAIARRAGAVFEALLLQQMLEPIARGEEALGEYGAACVAQSIARDDAHGFGAAIARVLERDRG
ncbi:MAG TPA: hypothetical protein VIN40_04245 [Candidatus Tyrphobacter sp.]